ncbi:MAG: tetratricopeptide repeat protein [Verrucomicrobiota bacterium]|jgi:tetratricopeptide (TPR) repeat protein
MNAYLLAASFTRSQPALVNLGLRRSSCASTIVCADNVEEAQKRFEAWLWAPPAEGSPVDILIHKVVAAPFVDQLLTETKSVPLDWPQIAMQAQSDLESTPADDFEQGYWVDVNAVLPPSISLDDLRHDLPEDISSGLNWAEDKQFFFLLSVLSPPPPPPPEPWEEPEAGHADGAETPEEAADESAPAPGEADADFPELAGKEAAALIRARNSAVAAWLWRNYAADTKLAGNQIRIDPWCGVLRLEVKSDPDAAIAESTKAIELKPDDAMLYINRGNAKKDKGDLGGAIADYTKAIELKPDFAYGAYYDRGNTTNMKGDYEGAIADYSKAIELKPDCTQAYTGRGAAKHHKGDLEGAIADYSKAIELDPNNAIAYTNRGLSKQAAGDMEGAIADYTKVIALTPDDAKAYAARGYVKRNKDDLDGALADFMKALELNPKYAWAHHACGCLRYDAQEFEEALADFSKVLELDDAQKAYASFRIWLIRARLGETETASAKLQTYLDSHATGKEDDWESKIGRFLCGQLAEPELLAAAKNADQKKEAGQLCQAYFYAGSKHLFAGDNAAAEDYFQKSIATNQRAYTEYSSAAAELGFLKAQYRIGPA